jgi:hypothetical protein
VRGEQSDERLCEDSQGTGVYLCEDSQRAGLLQCEEVALAPSCSTSVSNDFIWSCGLVVRVKDAGVEVAGSNPGGF